MEQRLLYAYAWVRVRVRVSLPGAKILLEVGCSRPDVFLAGCILLGNTRIPHGQYSFQSLAPAVRWMQYYKR